jgi:metal transporter CNNM
VPLRKGASCDYFTLILQGKVSILAGSDDFESELGPWCYLGQKALTMDPFTPDFRASPKGACRLLYIRRGDYKVGRLSLSHTRTVVESSAPIARESAWLVTQPLSL